jgi:hypothetical protein
MSKTFDAPAEDILGGATRDQLAAMSRDDIVRRSDLLDWADSLPRHKAAFVAAMLLNPPRFHQPARRAPAPGLGVSVAEVISRYGVAVGAPAEGGRRG